MKNIKNKGDILNKNIKINTSKNKAEVSQSSVMKIEEENFIKNLPETADLMTKINPSQIDIYKAAFGGESAAYALAISKKLQLRSIRKS